MKYGAVITAGGSSRRFGGTCKVLEMLDGAPVIIHSIRAFRSFIPDGQIVVTAPENLIGTFVKTILQYLPDASGIRVVKGGGTRVHSVLNGLEALPPDTAFAAVHDAARPLGTPALFKECFEACVKHGGAMAVSRVTDTLKTINTDGLLTASPVPRDKMYAAETPQVFPCPELTEAARRAAADGGAAAFTDDASMMEHYFSIPAYPVLHDGPNFKITVKSDLVLAEALKHASRR